MLQQFPSPSSSSSSCTQTAAASVVAQLDIGQPPTAAAVRGTLTDVYHALGGGGSTAAVQGACAPLSADGSGWISGVTRLRVAVSSAAVSAGSGGEVGDPCSSPWVLGALSQAAEENQVGWLSSTSPPQVRLPGLELETPQTCLPKQFSHTLATQQAAPQQLGHTTVAGAAASLVPGTRMTAPLLSPGV